MYELVQADQGAALSLFLAVDAALKGRTVLYLDAANSFNPYVLARILRRRRSDTAPLRRVHISRAFTCHQLEALVRGRMRPAAQKFGADTVILSDIGALLYDEDVPPEEARRVALSLLDSLSAFDGVRRTVVLSPAGPDRQAIVSLARARAGRVLQAVDRGGAFEVLPWAEPSRRLPSSSRPK